LRALNLSASIAVKNERHHADTEQNAEQNAEAKNDNDIGVEGGVDESVYEPVVRRQHLWDRTGGLRKGGFLAHRSSMEERR
jgi:hypothetical protein